MTIKELERLTLVRALATSGEAKRRREAAGLSLREVGDSCGVDLSTVWRWEQGRRLPRGPAALQYARILDMLAPATEQAS